MSQPTVLEVIIGSVLSGIVSIRGARLHADKTLLVQCSNCLHSLWSPQLGVLTATVSGPAGEWVLVDVRCAGNRARTQSNRGPHLRRRFSPSLSGREPTNPLLDQ